MTLLAHSSPAAPAAPTAHVDTFVRDNLPPLEDWPRLDFSGLPELAAYPDRLNAAVGLLEGSISAGHGERPVFHFEGRRTTYRELLDIVNRYARVLVDDLGVVPGNRVLLRGFNNPTMAALWLAVVRVGGVVVTTMPLLRARELAYIFEKARVSVALCDARLTDELQAALPRSQVTPRTVYFGEGTGADGLDGLAATKSADPISVDTAADDPCLIAFTSGTTGQPKGAVHFHRDVLAICDTFSRYVARPTPEDVFAGAPPLAFTYGLGGLLLFPMRAGASIAYLEKVTPPDLLRTIQEQRVSVVYTSPTMYRALVDLVGQYDIGSLKTCVSAGEPLPLATYEAWRKATGLRILDGLGSTEMLHIFIAAAGDDIRPGATGKPVPGYEAVVLDDEGKPLPPDQVGKLAVRGPTGCRYLADPERQRSYVQNGWNLTGDAYRMDADGYFWFQARADDMIISAGYNIAGPEVENVLLDHPAVRECAVVAAPDEQRGHVVKAFVVLRDPAQASPALVEDLQAFVKREIAPYKYPRLVEFVETLPRTETGKLQRYKLRQAEAEQQRAQPA